MHHARPEARQLQHFVVGDRSQAAGFRQNPRVGRVDAVDVGVDLAQVGIEHGGQGHGRGVGAAAAERRDVAVLINPLKPGCDHDRPVGQQFLHVVGRDRLDARLGMRRVGADADLGSGEAHRLAASRLNRHRKQRHAHLLSRREEHVHLTGAGAIGDLLGQIDENVGLVAHRAHHHDNLIASLVAGDRLAGRRLNLLRVGHARAAKFLHH